MRLDELREHVRLADTDSASAPLLRLESDDDVYGLVGWFGEDRSRVVVNLVLRGENVGCIRRDDVYDLVASQTMGFGDAAHAALEGVSTGWTSLVLQCPEPRCPESPLYAVSFDADRPPRCSVHDEPLSLQ